MRILLAAADRDLLESYRELLRMEFGETRCAFDGAQLLELLAESPDLVILDPDLPGGDVRELFARLQAERAPVILLLGGPAAALPPAQELRTFASLSYPFLPESLFRLIRELTEARNGEEQDRKVKEHE